MKKAELVVRKSPEGALDWARNTLPGVSRTFALNIGLLPAGLRNSVTVGYLLCRTADALEDSWPGAPGAIRERFDTLLAAVEGDAAAARCLSGDAVLQAHAGTDLRLVAGLETTLSAAAALEPADRPPLVDCLRVMIAGMRHYAARAAERGEDAPYLDDEHELHHYCHAVAGCVGEMLTRLFERRAGDTGTPLARERLRLAPIVGEALQLTNILLDWPRDLRAGRSHVPGSWLAEHGLSVRALGRRDSPGHRQLAVRLEAMARAALAQIPDYLQLVPVAYLRYRAFCLWPSLWARASLERAMRDARFPDSPARPRLSRTELWGWAVRSLPALRDDRALRRMFAVAG